MRSTMPCLNLHALTVDVYMGTLGKEKSGNDKDKQGSVLEQEYR